MSSPPGGFLSEWITGVVGRFPLLDSLMGLLASDFLIPVTMSLIFLWLWFGTRDQATREKNQRAIFCGSTGLGFAGLAVYWFNKFVDPWPRPFEVYESARIAVETLFYASQDPSFPSHGAAVTFAMALGAWFGNRRAGAVLFALAGLWGVSRIYVGSHYLLDILAGACIGMLISYFFKYFFVWIEPFPTYALKLARKLFLG